MEYKLKNQLYLAIKLEALYQKTIGPAECRAEELKRRISQDVCYVMPEGQPAYKQQLKVSSSAVIRQGHYGDLAATPDYTSREEFVKSKRQRSLSIPERREAMSIADILVWEIQG